MIPHPRPHHRVLFGFLVKNIKNLVHLKTLPPGDHGIQTLQALPTAGCLQAKPSFQKANAGTGAWAQRK
jgi:hypothetical protein